MLTFDTSNRNSVADLNTIELSRKAIISSGIGAPQPEKSNFEIVLF